MPWLGYPALFRAGEWIFDFNLSVEPRSSQPWQLYLRTVYSSLGTSKGADRRFINWNHFYNAWLCNQDIIKFLRFRRKTIIFLVQHMQNLSWNCTWFVYQIPMRAVINKSPPGQYIWTCITARSCVASWKFHIAIDRAEFHVFCTKNRVHFTMRSAFS